MKLYIVIFLLFVCLTSCDDDESIQGVGQLDIEFDSKVGDEDLVLNEYFTNAHDESFSLTRLNYYISNIVLTTDNGVEYVVPQDSSYFLIREDDEESHHVTIRNVPAGDYNRITFTVGVDSLRSTLDISKRQGVLDPAQGHDGMYWTWNSGYIFFKMEGNSPAAPEEQSHAFYYHIGGYGGYETPSINNIRNATVDMGNSVAQVRANKSPEVHLHVDVLEFFKNPTPIKIAEHSTVMFSEYSTVVSANYINMFKFDHVHN